MYNKTIIAFRFSATLYNQGLGNLINIQDISKLSSNTVYMSVFNCNSRIDIVSPEQHGFVFLITNYLSKNLNLFNDHPLLVGYEVFM